MNKKASHPLSIVVLFLVYAASTSASSMVLTPLPREAFPRAEVAVLSLLFTQVSVDFGVTYYGITRDERPIGPVGALTPGQSEGLKEQIEAMRGLWIEASSALEAFMDVVDQLDRATLYVDEHGNEPRYLKAVKALFRMSSEEDLTHWQVFRCRWIDPLSRVRHYMMVHEPTGHVMYLRLGYAK